MTVEIEFEELMLRASLCERAEFYEEMVNVMKKAIKLMDPSTTPSAEEGELADASPELKQPSNSILKNPSTIVKARNLFSVAYKNLASAKRASWRILTSELEKYRAKDVQKEQIVREYMEKVENELKEICDDVLKTIDDLIFKTPSFKDIESTVFFYKMKGDYNRYKAEICEENQEESTRFGGMSCEDYLKAIEVGQTLKSTNPVKLGLALNYSVYLYEISKDSQKACDVAREAFDIAIADLEELNEEHYKDSTLIMQLLRDNISLWTRNNDPMKEEDDEQMRRDGEGVDER